MRTIEEAKAVIKKSFSGTLKIEVVPLTKAVGRVLSEDIVSMIDVPSFDRSSMDGYAVIAEDTFNAEENRPVKLRLKGRIEAGEMSEIEVAKGEAVEVSTGAIIPKGANAVVMVEYTEEKEDTFKVYRSTSPNENITAAGSDISVGETVLRQGTLITYREMGILAATGCDNVRVYVKPTVAILSTGNELAIPGATLSDAEVYDINSYSLLSSVMELGCNPVMMRVVRDDEHEIKLYLLKALESADVIITSGSTSAGFGDKIYRVFEEIEAGCILIHGLAVKPGKPTIVAKVKDKPVFGLPGYPSSAMTIFHVLVKPYLNTLSGFKVPEEKALQAKFAVKMLKSKGRREFLPVHIIHNGEDLIAYPILKGSGAITSFSLADGYIEMPAKVEFIDEGEIINVQLYSSKIKPANLVIIGSHCPAIDLAVSMLLHKHPEYKVKLINVGSRGGLNAAIKGEADIAGTHLLDGSRVYNRPYVRKKYLSLVRGYNRQQGFIFRSELKFNGLKDLVKGGLRFINRNRGSGTRALIDLLIEDYCRRYNFSPQQTKSKIKGYEVECKTHSGVASAIKNGKADVGVAVKAYADWYGLNFKHISLEEYDLIIRKDKMNKPELKALIETLMSPEFKEKVESKIPGIIIPKEVGRILKN